MNSTLRPHRYKLLDGEVVPEGSVSSVAPRLFVNGHAVFPFVFEQVPRLVAIGTCVISTMGADGSIAPAIVGHHSVTYRTAKEHRGTSQRLWDGLHKRHLLNATCRCRARLRTLCCSSTCLVRLHPHQTRAPQACTLRQAHKAQAAFYWWESSL